MAAKAASEWRSHAQFFALSLIMVCGAEKNKTNNYKTILEQPRHILCMWDLADLQKKSLTKTMMSDLLAVCALVSSDCNTPWAVQGR